MPRIECGRYIVTIFKDWNQLDMKSYLSGSCMWQSGTYSPKWGRHNYRCVWRTSYHWKQMRVLTTGTLRSSWGSYLCKPKNGKMKRLQVARRRGKKMSQEMKRAPNNQSNVHTRNYAPYRIMQRGKTSSRIWKERSESATKLIYPRV